MNETIPSVNDVMGTELVFKSDTGELVTTSLKVAEVFDKEHRHVIRTIENLTAQNWAVKNFYYADEYLNLKKQKQPMYYMNRDGMSLLCMGFTGKKALEWKLKYIDAFNKMEEALRAGTPKENLPTYQYLIDNPYAIKKPSGRVVLNSVALADMFNQDHSFVIKRIHKILGTINESPTDYFLEGTFINPEGFRARMYEITVFGLGYISNIVGGISNRYNTLRDVFDDFVSFTKANSPKPTEHPAIETKPESKEPEIPAIPTSSGITVTDFVKTFEASGLGKLNRVKMYKCLNESGLVERKTYLKLERWVATELGLNSGLIESELKSFKRGNKDMYNPYCRISNRGIEFFNDVFSKRIQSGEELYGAISI